MSSKPREPFCLVSACLAGCPCRYDGTACVVPELKNLAETGLAIPVCPEELGGLPTPRPPAEIRQGRVITRAEHPGQGGHDVTAQFAHGAAATLALAQANNVSLAILKERSPSCGSNLIYDGTFSRTVIPGQGLAAALRRIVTGE